MKRPTPIVTRDPAERHHPDSGRDRAICRFSQPLRAAFNSYINSHQRP